MTPMSEAPSSARTESLINLAAKLDELAECLRDDRQRRRDHALQRVELGTTGSPVVVVVVDGNGAVFSNNALKRLNQPVDVFHGSPSVGGNPEGTGGGGLNPPEAPAAHPSRGAA